MPAYYLVCNTAFSMSLGIFKAESADEALAAESREAGCDGSFSPDVVAFPLTATVTARGAASTVPDRADAVDFDVKAGDVTVSVTLLVDPFSGQLDVWGAPDQWCADPKQARRDLGQGWEAAVVAVCRAVA